MDGWSLTACCGDELLARALLSVEARRMKIKAPSQSSSTSFTGETPFSQRFKKENWCSPIYTFHHVSNEEIALLWEFEQEIEENLLPDDTIRFADVFDHFIPDYLRNATDVDEHVEANWENRAEDIRVEPKEGRAYDSEFCSQACEEHGVDCWTWMWKEGDCHLGIGTLRIGARSSGYTSGTRLDRLRAFRETQKCEGRPLKHSI